MASDTGCWRLVRDMSSTAGEFERALRLAAPAPVLAMPDGALRLNHDGVELTIRLSCTGKRVIAGLSLPKLQAEYEFRGPRDTANQLLDRLDLAMRRGGG